MTLASKPLIDVLARLTRREATRTEADAQADVRQLFLTAPLQLGDDDVRNVVLESPLGDRRRIDVEIGSMVVEVKRDLRRGKVKALDRGMPSCSKNFCATDARDAQCANQ